MDSKESHITTFVRMAPWGDLRVGRKKAPPFLVMNPRADNKKRGGETREGSHKGTHGSLSLHQGSKALVRRHTTCVPTRANR